MTASGSADAIDSGRAAAILAEFAASTSLALRFPADGCYARTHLLVQQLIERGLAPGKIWAFAASATDLLWIETSDQPEGRVQWRYHVAPVLLMRGPDELIQEMVIDPLLFERVASVEEWRDALHDTPTLVRTVPGQPPLPALGGSGYWPGLDPLEGPDVHARETLEEYERPSV